LAGLRHEPGLEQRDLGPCAAQLGVGHADPSDQAGADIPPLRLGPAEHRLLLGDARAPLSPVDGEAHREPGRDEVVEFVLGATDHAQGKLRMRVQGVISRIPGTDYLKKLSGDDADDVGFFS